MKHSISLIGFLSAIFPLASLSQPFNNYQSQFTQRYGEIEGCIWNMAKEQSITITTRTKSTISVYGANASYVHGYRKLATFSEVIGQQTLWFDCPFEQKNLYVTVDNGTTTHGYTIPTSNATITDNEVQTPTNNISEYIHSETMEVPIDEFALALLKDGSNNTGKVTQSSKYISDGNPITVTPVYSNCGYNNTFGIYLQEGNEIGQTIDLWTKTSNHTSGTMSRPVFTINIPEGIVFGYYIRNSNGTYYSDATFNTSQARAAGVFKGDDCWYLAFEDMPLTGDMDYNDMVFRIKASAQVLDNDPAQWTLAAEVDLENSDFDFNDAVFKFSFIQGERHIVFTPIACGTPKDVEIYLGDQHIGEMHELLQSSKGQYVNVNGSKTKPNEKLATEVAVPEDFSLANGMGGFSFVVDGLRINAPQQDEAPQLLLIANGDWEYPAEGSPIESTTPEFPWKASDNTGILPPRVSTNEQTTIFNLNGNRVNETAKGVFIINGHKTICK